MKIVEFICCLLIAVVVIVQAMAMFLEIDNKFEKMNQQIELTNDYLNYILEKMDWDNKTEEL